MSWGEERCGVGRSGVGVMQSSTQTKHFFKALAITFYIKTPETEGRGRIRSGTRTFPKLNVHPPPFSLLSSNSVLLSQGTPVDGMMSHP